MQRAAREEPRWHAAVAVVAIFLLYVTLPPKIVLGPFWLMPLIVTVILVPLLIISPRRRSETRMQRTMSIATVAVLNAFNIGTVVTLLIQQISVHYRKPITGEAMLLAAVEIWFTNLIVYALWYWEIDGRGPDVRSREGIETRQVRGDFLFPQMALDEHTQERLDWSPKFIDYVFLAFTNATAFSPADTFPLTAVAKVLMMAEALTSLVTIAIIAARALSLIGG